MQIELRSNEQTQLIELGGQRWVRGYATKFYDGTENTQADMGDFVMRIRPNAFDNVLNSPDVELRLNHSRDWVLGNRKSGLETTKDNVGIIFSHPFDKSDPDFQRMESKLQKGLFTGNSWKGTASVEWSCENEKDVAWISNVDTWEDVAVVDKPAIPATGQAMIMSADCDLSEQHKLWVETKKRKALL